MPMRVFVVSAVMFAVFSLAGPAFAQSLEEVELYRVIDDATGAETLAHLETGQLSGGHTYLLLTQFYPPATPGGPAAFKVFAGIVDRGGLGIHYARLQEAVNPFQMLKRPALIQIPGEHFKPGFTCQVTLFPPDLPYSCFDLAGNIQTGRIVPQR